MGVYSEDININGMTYSSDDDLNNQMANKIYQFLLNTGDFATDVEISSGFPYNNHQHLISITDNSIYIDNVKLDITVSSGTLYIKHISTDVISTTSTTTFKLTTFLRNLTIANGEVSCDDDFTLIYRGYEAMSFFINVSTNVNNGMNLRFFEFIVFYGKRNKVYYRYGGTRNITVTANTYNPVITTEINAISRIYGVYSSSVTPTISDMYTYSTTPNTVFDDNQYTWGKVIEQEIVMNSETYHFASLMVGNTNYYSQFEYCYIHDSTSFKRDEGVYYCFSDGCLLKVGGAETPVSSS